MEKNQREWGNLDLCVACYACSRCKVYFAAIGTLFRWI